MENVINTKLLEYEKNTFLIDLVEHDSGGKHVRIIQTSQTKTDKPERSVMDILVLNCFRILLVRLMIMGKE
jgi:hypothetical protein